MMRRKAKGGAPIKRTRIPVLIVDDDSFLADTFQLILEDAGFYVETAGTARQALEKAEVTPFRLVITDLKLPDMRGNELSRLLKEKLPGVSVILLTGMSNVEKGADKRDPDEVLRKPIDPLELLRVSNSISGNM